MKFLKYLFPILLVVLTNCANDEVVKIVSQKSGSIRTNCYLIYGEQSNEGVIIDVAAEVDTLVDLIHKKNIELKYILLTHGHQDHVKGIPALKELFPDAKLCFSKQEYDDLKKYEDWKSIFSKELVEAWSADSIMNDLMTYNYDLIDEPDIFLSDGDVLNIGNFQIKVLATPGHTRGSLTYVMNNDIFSGDLIFYRSDGNMNCTLTSWDDIKKSILKLYEQFPDSAVIHPGHFISSDIRSEKKENRNASYDKLKSLKTKS